MTVVPKIKIRRAFYRDMFLIAKQNASLSQQAKNAQEELHHSIVAIIMACCSLEAFINTYAMQKHWNKWDKYERNKSIKKKWLDTTREYSIDGTTFNEKGQPYEGFSVLIDLRNSLVHYKVKPAPPVRSKKGLISKQEDEYTASKAVWAVETAQRMIKEFCRFAGEPIPNWLEL